MQSDLTVKNRRVSEILENLLQRSLTNGVLLQIHFLLLVFYKPKQVASCLAVSGQSKLEKVSALLNELNFFKLIDEFVDHFDAVNLGVDVGDQVGQPDIPAIAFGFLIQIRADAFVGYLFNDDVVDVATAQQTFPKVHQLSDRFFKAELFCESLLFLVSWFVDLYFKLEAGTIL